MENKDNLGNLAYYDSQLGLIPCKVTSIRVYNEFGHYQVNFTVTATRGAYKKGEKLYSAPRYVVPRKMVHIRNGQYGIKTDYAWHMENGKTYAIINKRVQS